MKKSSKAPIFLAAKQSYFTEKMQLLPGEKKTKLFFLKNQEFQFLKFNAKKKMKKSES